MPTDPDRPDGERRTGPSAPPGMSRGPYEFGYRRSRDQDAAAPVRHPVVVVGAGPVGLALAIDLALRGQRVVLLDDAARIGEGSRAICFAKRTLEIFDRLGVAAPMLEKGVTWKLGRVFHRDDELFSFDLLPETGHAMPAFINLQQYYVERFLVERVGTLPSIDLRWSNRVTAIEPRTDGVGLLVDTPEGPYRLETDWLVACDGANSKLRGMVGAAFVGEVFEDRFLIADVKMHAAFPTERWFWFDPPFHAGQSALLHRQPDDVWRIDLQLGWEADPAEERKPERVVPRIVKMLGHDDFSLEWVSVYTFQCRRMERFVHGRVLFAGDAAHQVSPFGARGANSGIQDAENLAWKLALVLAGEAPPSLVATYDLERSAAADENIGHSTRSTDFIAPRSAMEHRLRDGVLALARRHPFARGMINSGRLSSPSAYAPPLCESPLVVADREPFAGSARLGGPLPDAAIARPDGSRGFLLGSLGDGISVIHVPNGARPNAVEGADLVVVGDTILDPEGQVAARLDATPGATYVVRPDHHLAARMRHFDRARVAEAIRRIRTGG